MSPKHQFRLKLNSVTNIKINTYCFQAHLDEKYLLYCFRKNVNMQTRMKRQTIKHDLHN